MENRKILKLISYVLIILTAVVARLIPHPPNFAPIGGLALFSGSYFKKKPALLIPLIAMLISDIFLGFHSTIFYVYFSFIIITFIGQKVKTLKFSNLFFASLISSVLFFLITNFGVWLSGNMYPKTIDGLLQSYIMGLPFFRNTILGDLFYSLSFFYGYRYLIDLFRKKFSHKLL